MPRAPFNRVFSFYGGPNSSSPGVLRFTGLGRFVLADGILQAGVGAPLIEGWITTESGMPVPSWTSPLHGSDPRVADQVSFDGAPVSHWVVFTESVVWQGSSYFRASIAGLPLPAACDCSDPPPPVGDPMPAAVLYADWDITDPATSFHGDAAGVVMPFNSGPGLWEFVGVTGNMTNGWADVNPSGGSSQVALFQVGTANSTFTPLPDYVAGMPYDSGVLPVFNSGAVEIGWVRVYS